jgi:hypothetical protein
LHARPEGYFAAARSGHIEDVLPADGRRRTDWQEERGRSARRQTLLFVAIGGGVALLLAGGIIAFFLWPNVTLYVDNGGDAPMDISIDGEKKATVAPGAWTKIRLRSGTRKIVATSQGRTLYDESKQVDAGTYLLNPGQTCRYHTWKVDYGLAIPKFEMAFDDRDRFKKLAQRVELVPVGAWMKTEYEHVLEPPPKQIHTKSKSHSETRTALSRISVEDYDYIVQARNKEDVTAADLRKLEEVMKRIEASCVLQ